MRREGEIGMEQEREREIEREREREREREGERERGRERAERSDILITHIHCKYGNNGGATITNLPC